LRRWSESGVEESEGVDRGDGILLSVKLQGCRGLTKKNMPIAMHNGGWSIRLMPWKGYQENKYKINTRKPSCGTNLL
jgi:hypothetical protein